MSSQRGNAQTPYYARFFTFTLSVDAQVTIDLSSSRDTYLYLLSGHGSGGARLHYNDDADSSTYDSRLVVDLDAGAYTVEATTFSARRTGSFALTVGTDIEASTGETVAAAAVSNLAAAHRATVGGVFSAGFTYEPATAEVSVSVSPEGLRLALSDRSGPGLAGSAGVAGTPARAGRYTVTLTFTQTGRVDTHSFTVTAACPAGHTQQDDRSCQAPQEDALEEQAPEGAVCPAASWGALGLGTRTVATAAVWSATSCLSQNRPSGGYARYFNFTLDAAHSVAIDLSSQHDTYLYLMSGHDTRKGFRHRNDDIDWPDNANSQILERLPAGDYTVEATTYRADKTGRFNLQARVVAAPALAGFDRIHEVTVGQSLSTGFTYRPAAAELTTTVNPPTLTATVVDRDGHVGLAATPRLAGTYTIALRFAQPGRVDTRTITITATCPSGQAPFHTGGGLCVAVTAVPSGCAVTALAAHTPWWGRTGATGAYSLYGPGAPAACASLSQNNRAKYYSFTVPDGAPADGLPARMTLEPLQRRLRPEQTPPALTSGGGSPSVTLWRYAPASGPNQVQQIALTTARPATDPVLTATLTAGDYLIEIAPTGTVTAGSFQLSVWVPSPQRAHSDVQHVGNTGPRSGMTLPQFLDTRGSAAKSRSMSPSDPSDPASPTHPWLAFNADWCSVPPSWQVNLLETIANLLTGADVDLAQYIVQQPNFGGVTVPFYYGCLRHDFNWRNLHRVKHFFGYDAAGVWNDDARRRADERLKQDHLVLCNANRRGQPEVPDSWDWMLSEDHLRKCESVASAFRVGVGVPRFETIDYSH